MGALWAWAKNNFHKHKQQFERIIKWKNVLWQPHTHTEAGHNLIANYVAQSSVGQPQKTQWVGGCHCPTLESQAWEERRRSKGSRQKTKKAEAAQSQPQSCCLFSFFFIFQENFPFFAVICIAWGVAEAFLHLVCAPLHCEKKHAAPNLQFPETL